MASAPLAKADDRVARELRRLDVERLTPLQALTRLAELKQLAHGGEPTAKPRAKEKDGDAPSLFRDAGA